MKMLMKSWNLLCATSGKSLLLVLLLGKLNIPILFSVNIFSKQRFPYVFVIFNMPLSEYTESLKYVHCWLDSTTWLYFLNNFTSKVLNFSIMSTINNVLSSMLYQLRQLTDLMLPRSLFLGDSERQAEREINIHIALGKIWRLLW